MLSRRIVSLLLWGVGLGSAGVWAAEQPPQQLFFVGDHWTAWQPPSTFPEGAEIYIIERGDTLWDLAARFYGDPYLWPQIWELNRYIEDAHWIYPGDPLALEPAVTPVEQLAEQTVTAPGESPAWSERDSPFATFEGGPVALGSESDIACSGYIGVLEETFDIHLIGSEYDSLTPTLNAHASLRRGSYGLGEAVKTRLSTADIVYLDGGAEVGLSAGQVFTVVEPRDEVVHPITQEVVGRHYVYNGSVRVLSVQAETATAEIVHTCRPMVVGATLKPYEEQPIPLGRRLPMRPFNDPPAAEELADAPVVLYSDAKLVSLGSGHLVYIDRGAADDVAPGDLFTVYRHNRRQSMPPVVLGELAVLSVQPRASLARILESRYPVYIGDPLEAR